MREKLLEIRLPGAMAISAAAMLALAGCLADDVDMDADITDPTDPGNGEPDTFTISGEAPDLEREGLVLTLNADEDLAVDEAGTFEFETELESGESYAVVVTSNPDEQACHVDNGDGTIDGSDIDDLLITCDRFAAVGHSGEPGELTVQQVGPGTADLVVSTDPDCDWNEPGTCPDGEVIPDATGGPDSTTTLTVEDDFFEPDTRYFFALRTELGVSRVGSGEFNRGYPADDVNAIETDSDRLYLGGRIGGLVMNQEGLLRTQAAGQADSGDLLNVGEQLSASIRAIHADKGDNWFLAGSISTEGSDAHYGLRRMTPSGQLDPDFLVTVTDAPGTSLDAGSAPATSVPASIPGFSTALDLAVHDTTVYLGGTFEGLDGEERSGLAAVDAETGELLSDRPDEAVDAKAVSALIIHDDTLFIAGIFDDGGNERPGLAALDLDTGEAIADWEIYAGDSESVLALAADDDHVYVGGDFEEIAGESRRSIAAFDRASGDLLSQTEWEAEINDSFSNRVDILTLHGDYLYLGGEFTEVNNSTRYHAAAVDRNDGSLSDWDLGIHPTDSSVTAMTIHDDVMYFGGRFDTVGDDDPPPPMGETSGAPQGNPTQRMNSAAADVDTGEILDWHMDILPFSGSDIYDLYSPVVLDIGVSDGEVLLGGIMEATAVVEVGNLVAYDLDTGVADPDWAATVQGVVESITLDDDHLYLGGDIGFVDGEAREGLAALYLSDGELVETWQPEIDDVIFDIADVQVHGDDVYISGRFDSISGEAREGAAAVDRTDGTVSDWDPEIDDHNNTPVTMTIDDDRVFLVGEFDEVGGENRTNIAAVEAGDDGDVITGWDPGDGIETSRTSPEYSLTTDGDVLYVGGDIDEADGQVRSEFAAFATDDGELEDWDPQAQSSGIRAMAFHDDRIYAGSWRTIHGAGNGGTRLAAIDTDGDFDTDWTPAPNAAVNAIHISDGHVYVGGEFTQIAGEPRRRFAVLDPDTGELIW